MSEKPAKKAPDASQDAAQDAPKEKAPGEKAPAGASVRVSGRLVGKFNTGARRVFLVAFGIVYFQQLGRLLAWLFGRHVTAELTLTDTAIRARTATGMMGTRLGETDEVFPLAALSRVAVARTAGGTFLWAGGALFVAAVALAGVLAFRGRVGFGGSLALAAVAFVMLGLALDVGAYALVQRLHATSRARLEIVSLDGRWLGVAGVPREDARRFVDEVALRLPKARRE
jgi:hypothetical protein